MDHKYKSNKELFKSKLAPMFEVLEYKKTLMDSSEWMAFVSKTQASILNNPDQFLGRELPASCLIEIAVMEIFAEFLAQQEAEALQTN
jgi:hypothetical protein